MRKLICRLTMFPLILIGSPLIYFIGWCFVGHKESMDTLTELLSDTWNTMEDKDDLFRNN